MSYTSNRLEPYYLKQIKSIPNLVAFWDFSEAAPPYLSKTEGSSFPLTNGVGATVTTTSEPNALSGFAANFDGTTDYLKLAANELGRLNVSSYSNEVTVVAQVFLNDGGTGFVGGAWTELNSDPRRQYGLFVNLPTYGGANSVCGHISKLGGASPNIPFSRDYSASPNKTAITAYTWIAFTFDGSVIKSYHDMRLSPTTTYTEPGAPDGESLTYPKNPYVFPDGLYKGNQGDFTVGANFINPSFGNFLNGKIGALLVFDRALTQRELYKIKATTYNDPFTYFQYSYGCADITTGGNRGRDFGMTVLRSIGAINDSASTPAVTSGFRAVFLSNRFFLSSSLGKISNSFVYSNSNDINLPVESIKSIGFLLNNASASDILNIAVQVEGVWYLSTTNYQMSVDGATSSSWATTAEKKELQFSVIKDNWLTMVATPGTELSVGTNPSFNLSGVLQKVGVYSPATAVANMRIDLLTVKTLTPAFNETNIRPLNTSAPSITGNRRQGGVLSINLGSWLNDPTSFSYRWKRNGITIAGAFSATYTLVSADVGQSITCFVVANNSQGSYSVETSAITI